MRSASLCSARFLCQCHSSERSGDVESWRSKCRKTTADAACRCKETLHPLANAANKILTRLASCWFQRDDDGDSEKIFVGQSWLVTGCTAFWVAIGCHRAVIHTCVPRAGTWHSVRLHLFFLIIDRPHHPSHTQRTVEITSAAAQRLQQEAKELPPDISLPDRPPCWLTRDVITRISPPPL